MTGSISCYNVFKISGLLNRLSIIMDDSHLLMTLSIMHKFGPVVPEIAEHLFSVINLENDPEIF